ncbi:hypothetical protein FE249_19095 (plasmid) [Acidiphilium multivorum]|uniref:hypothetical protein n=1 Tax=Acidiphilium multivorum TaxID=62140 RepID=UPI001F4C3B34|nr:hypothetical protein [Acidiphilium multivorum]UNC16316.1 hypothetical protein FE249_19095 [Acidiphilium multivorum]
MTNYYSTVAVHEPLPLALLSTLEREILNATFQDAQPDGELIHLFASETAGGFLEMRLSELRKAFESLPDKATGVGRTLAAALEAAAAEGCTDDDMATVDIDEDAWLAVLQDISARLPQQMIRVTAAWTSSKPEPQATGGSAMLVTPKAIFRGSTDSLMEQFIDEVRQEVGHLNKAAPEPGPEPQP